MRGGLARRAILTRVAPSASTACYEEAGAAERGVAGRWRDDFRSAPQARRREPSPGCPGAAS
jgi:hypothetical protein